MSQSIGQQHNQYQYQQQQMALITSKKTMKQIIPQAQQSSKEKGKNAKTTQSNYNRLYTENSQGSISSRQIFVNQCQKTSTNCLFCNKCKKPSQFSLMISTALYSKYSASQNYYFTKDINDILANQRTSAVINLKDIQTYDEIEEYLNRFYFLHEYDNKIKRLTEYYKFHRDIARLFMVPTTNILNKFHDKKRRIYYIQITRMLKEKEEKEGKKDNQDEQALKADQKSKKEDQIKDEKNKKIEKELNVDDKNNDQCKSLNENERFLAPLDDLDEQTKSIQSNTLQDLNHKLNDILINSTKSMQSYFFDQDVSQSIGNLSNFLNHLKTQSNQQINSQTGAGAAPQRQSENILNNQILTETVSNEFVGFNSQQFQNILSIQGKNNPQPLLIHHQILQNSNTQELKSGQSLVKNSQTVKNFLKKDSFSKKSSNELKQQILQNSQNPQQTISNNNKLKTENSIGQQLFLNNSPPLSQRNIQEPNKINIAGSKTERESYNLSKDDIHQNHLQKVNQDMINLVNFKPQIEQQQQQVFNSKNKVDQTKDLQKGIAAISSQPSQYLSSVQTQNPSQHQSLNEKQGSNLKQQSINSAGYNKYQVDGQISITGFSANNTLNVARNSEKNSANQSIKDTKNYDYPFSNQLSEFTTGKQSITQSVERNSLNSLQQSINGVGKQLNTDGQILSSQPSEQLKNGLQSKLMSNTSSKYQSQQNKEQRSLQNQQILQNTSQNQKIIQTQSHQNSMNQDQITNKKNFNTQSQEQLIPKKLTSNTGLIIPQMPLPSGQLVSSAAITQQQNQQTLSQQLSQQFQQQFSQQLQNYQRSQVQELQQFSASQRQFSQQSKTELKNEDVQKPPNTDRSQYNKKNNQQTLSQKTLSARDKDLSNKTINKGTIDLNLQKQKAYEAINARRENQFDIQVTLQRNNLDNDLNFQNIQVNQTHLKQNQVQIQNFIINNQQANSKYTEPQQYSNLQNLIQGTIMKNSSDNLKTYQNNIPSDQIQQYQQLNGHGRTQTMETYRESNVMQSDIQSYSQSQQASRNQSKTKQNPPSQSSNANLHHNPGSQSTQMTNIQSRQTSQQKSQNSINSTSQQMIQNQFQQQNSQLQSKNQLSSNENLNINSRYPKVNEFDQGQNPLIAQHIKQQMNTESNLKQIENLQNIPSQNDLSQSHQGQVFLKKSLSNYKFENLGELKQIYKEVQKRTAAMFQKHKDSLKNAQTTATNSSMQDAQQLKQNSQRLNYYAKGENGQRGSQTQRGLQNSSDQSQSKEISPRIQRIQKTEFSYQNNSLIKQNSERDQNQRRVSSQIKNPNLGNNPNNIQNQQSINIKQQQGSMLNLGVSSLLLASQQINQNNRDQNLTAAQKKLQYKQQASKIGSEQNNRMIHSNPNVDFNKTSYISSYNNSANNTNIFAPGQQNAIQSQQGSGYSTIVNNFGSNSQLNTNSQIQSVANSHQNSSKKVLDKIKHTRINSMNAAASLHGSQNPSILASSSTFKSHIPAPQSYRQQTTQEHLKQPSQTMQQAQSQNYTQFMVSTQNSSNKKTTAHHKYTKSEADSLTQSTQPHNLSQNLVSQTNLGFSQLANSNIGNKQTIIKQTSSLQTSQSQQQLHGQQNISQILASNQQIQSLPSTNQLTQQTTAPETKRIMSSVQQTNQNSQSPQRNQYNSAGKKNQQQYFNYSNNNIINIFVNNHQENMKAAQQPVNVVSNQTNLHQNINSIINTQININKIQQQSFSQKSQNSPLKKSAINQINQGKLSARQSENFK